MLAMIHLIMIVVVRFCPRSAFRASALAARAVHSHWLKFFIKLRAGARYDSIYYGTLIDAASFFDTFLYTKK